MPMHDPFYPRAEEPVEFSIQAECEDGIKEISLHVEVFSVDASGNLTFKEDRELDGEEFMAAPTSLAWSFTHMDGFLENSFVKYRFEVETKNIFNSRSHMVEFAINPYPVTNEFGPVPVPVYVQGYSKDLFDIVLIPDKNLSSSAFDEAYPSIIKDEVLSEPTIKYQKRQFNFYINPESCGAVECNAAAGNYQQVVNAGTSGQVTQVQVIQHQPPENWENLRNLEAKAILHNNSTGDFASGAYPGLFSANLNSGWIMRHELGHIFGMSDEYYGGDHREAWILPNNWRDYSDAVRAAPNRHKSANSVESIEPGWWRICNPDGCQMNDVYRLVVFDEPCADRVLYGIIDNIVRHR